MGILAPKLPTHPQPTPADLFVALFAALRQSVSARFQTAASLLAQGANINGLADFRARSRWLKGGQNVPYDSVTALYDAAQRGDYEAVQFLLDRGADVRAKIRTLTSPCPVFGQSDYAIDTLYGLDGMRTSKERRIVELAEERFGVETEEDYTRRRDAFDGSKE
ncbi:hypothetical protein K458DRAFT_391780 [Lentithecium fluviatile CBS 122367]|uniref:Uncharacterized protein n=1 Tax=Lentithecium fluviatile CBS 122367 TaxID=1168545 RepID=A0A6G1ITX2_9PLEO|nr:hypothetical protein K458DRAFT_391780 [Lentithecium fluviatile CBS 122367]